jgi:hypothetical protein
MDRYYFDEVATYKFKVRNHPKPDSDFWERDGYTIGAWKYKDGEWVKYEDVKQLQAENEKLKAKIQKSWQCGTLDCICNVNGICDCHNYTEPKSTEQEGK